MEFLSDFFPKFPFNLFFIKLIRKTSPVHVTHPPSCTGNSYFPHPPKIIPKNAPWCPNIPLQILNDLRLTKFLVEFKNNKFPR
jgi:hypothetical protein